MGRFTDALSNFMAQGLYGPGLISAMREFEDGRPDLFGVTTSLARMQTDGVAGAFAAYNDAAKRLGLPVAEKLTIQRHKAIGARLKEHSFDAWQRAIDNLSDSPHCLGQNNQGWKANLDFIASPSGFQKLLEGTYRRDSNGNGTSANGRTSEHQRRVANLFTGLGGGSEEGGERR